MFLKELFKRKKDYTLEINQAREWIFDADAIVIAMGTGLAEANQLSYKKPHLVRAYFKDYYRMGYKSLEEIQGMYAQITSINAKAYWGYWARHIKHISYELELGNSYQDLLRLVRNRDYFVCTTNIDGQVSKAGFEPSRVWSINGDCRKLKCNKECCDKIYESKDLLEGMIKSMKGNLEVDIHKVPRCQHCGDYLVPDVQIGHLAGQLEWDKDYQDFIEEHKEEKIVFLIIGMDKKNDQMGLISTFEKMIDELPNAHLIKMHNIKKDKHAPKVLQDNMQMNDVQKVVEINQDLEEAIAQLASGVVSL